MLENLSPLLIRLKSSLSGCLASQQAYNQGDTQFLGTLTAGVGKGGDSSREGFFQKLQVQLEQQREKRQSVGVRDLRGHLSQLFASWREASSTLSDSVLVPQSNKGRSLGAISGIALLCFIHRRTAPF